MPSLETASVGLTPTQYAIDTRPADAEPLGNRRCAQAFIE
jgi:hypothetical protein